jgi:hypothetical protein
MSKRVNSDKRRRRRRRRRRKKKEEGGKEQHPDHLWDPLLCFFSSM